MRACPKTERQPSHFGAGVPELRAFQHAIASAGFGADGEIGVTDERSGDANWHHYIYTRINADPERCRRLDECARQIAAEHHVRYDSWEVARHVRTGPTSRHDGTLNPTAGI